MHKEGRKEERSEGKEKEWKKGVGPEEEQRGASLVTR